MIDINVFLSRIRERKRELGLEGDENHLRNLGHSRTPEKKELLRRMAKRAIHNGMAPIPCYIDGQLVVEEERDERSIKGNDTGNCP